MNVWKYEHCYKQYYRNLIGLFPKEPELGFVYGYSQKWFYALIATGSKFIITTKQLQNAMTKLDTKGL